MAWETCNKWRTGSRASFGFRRLWELQVLLRKLSALSFLPKPRTPLEVEIRREALEAGGRDNDDSPKRRRLLSVVLERIKLHIWCLENFLKIPEEATLIKLKTKVKKSGVRGVLVEGEIIRESGQVQKEIKTFWETSSAGLDPSTRINSVY